MSNFGIPQSINPVRYQASLGGNIKSTTVNNTSEQFQIELAIVKKVFYRKGTLLFSVINRGNSVSIVGNDTSSATASAPIPLESFGRNSDGKVFGGYRPVKVGSKIAVGYVNGERSAPIVLGVYPDNDESYEIVSPVSFETGEDSDKQIEDTVLGKKEITPSQNIIYQSGKGDILKTFNGKSLLYINANGSNYMDDINYAYDQIADTRDGNMDPITPRETRAQSWLLVHEDNPEDENTNGHRTRFYVNKNGEFQMIMFSPNNDSDNNLVVFTASKDDGFKLRKQFDTDDLDNSSEYVQFSIGSGNTAVLQSVDKDDASEISMLPSGLSLTTPNNGTMTFNGRSLKNMFGSISSAVDAANAASDKADKAANAGNTAQSAASEAASQALLASQAGEDAKQAAVDAQAAGEDAKAQADDTRNRIIYYSSISNEKDVAIPGKYIIINTDTYIKNGTIKTAHIEDGAITNAKIANLAVGTAQIEDAAITRAKIGNLAVGTAQIEDAAITDAKVGELSADHLKAGTIDFSVISGIHINASEIDVGKIVADQIFVNGLGDISKNLGTVTSGKITGTNVNDDVNNVQSDVDNLNSPNLMSIIEKQTVVKQYAGLTSQYNVILKRANDSNISTTALTTAYTNLNTFMTKLLTDTTNASNINRDTYKNLTDTYNMALSTVQNELSDSFNADIDNMQSSVSVASQAAYSATIVASQAATTGDNANQVASRAIVVANDAQSAGNNAISVANNASQAASNAILAGSQAAVKADKASTAASQAQIAGDNATSVANNASQAASNAILAGSQAAVKADKASTAASQAQIAGDNATSVANNATSIANSATSTADNAFSQAQAVGSQASSEIAVQSTATAKAQSTADNAFSQAQAVGSQASADIVVQSTATAKAQSTADNAFSQAQAVSSQASSEIAVQSTATAKAQSTADNAFSQAATAIDTGQAVSQAVTSLKDGSTLTIAELGNGLATKVSNSEYASYRDQTASQIGQLVTNSAFSAYQTQTADLIAQKVATSDFSAYQATTAKSIESKVESSDFNTYKTQTADLIDDKVSSSEYASDKTQTASEIADRVSNSAFSTYQTQTASQIAQKVDNGAFSAYQSTTADLIASKVATKDFSAYQATTAKSIESKVESSDFNTYKTQTADLIDDKVSSSEYASDKTQTASQISQMVSNSAFSAYQTQTASQIAQTVSNSAFSAYQQTTADLIASKVATSDFSAYQATTAKSIESKVESSDFNTYKTQTADLIDDKVSSSEYASDKTQTASEIADRVSNSAFSTYQTQTASQIASKVDNGDFSTYKTQTADLISSKVATSDFSSYKDQTATAINSKVESSDFNTYKTQTADLISSKVSTVDFNNLTISNRNLALRTATAFTMTGNGSTNNSKTMYSLSSTISKGTTITIAFDIASTNTTGSYNVQLLGGSWQGSGTSIPLTSGTQHQSYTITASADYSDGIQMRLDSSTSTVTVSNLIISESSKEVSWTPAPEDQATQSDITQSINNIHLGFKNPDGSTFQMNLSADGVALLDFSKIILNGTTNIANGTIGTAQIADAAITNAKIANLAVGTAQIANGAITNAQIGNAAVDTANIKDAAINSAKIASLAVGTAQIGDGAITNAKIGKLAVGTAQIADGAITNAQIGALAVDTANIKDAAISSAKIANLAVGTAQIGDAAITSAKIANLAVGTAQIANAAITDAQVGNVSANKLTAGTIDFNTITGKNINASNITTGKLSTDRLNVDKLSAVSANLGDVTTGSLKGVDIVANTFSTPNGSFTTDSNGNVVASNLTIRGVTNLVYNAALLGGSGSYIPGWGISNNGYYSNQSLHDGVPSIGYHNNTGAGAWVNFAQSKLYSLNGRTGLPYSASVWFLEVGSDTNLKYQFTLAFFDANGNRLDSGYVGNTWNGIGSRQDWRYVTINNAVSPSTAVYVAIQYWAYNGSGYGLFSSPMLTQTSQSTGYQPDTGNVINAGIITGSTINAGTINTNANNTASLYPFTADSSGKISSYSVDDHFASYARMYSGNIIISDRNMDANSGSNKYGGETAVIGGSSISLSAGYTVGKDTDFTKPLVAEGQPGTTQLILSGINGITLKGDDQKIHFHGMYSDSQPKGITFTPYGNINGDEGSTTGNWYVGYNLANMTAQFGIDNLSKNTINLYRPTFVDEIGAVGNRLDNGRLLLHAVDGDAQMYLLNDGQPGFVSPTIYNRTYPNGANVFVTSYGRIGRSTSASKYKLDITKETSISPANKLLSIDRSSWVDKNSAELLADSKTNGTELSEPEINVNRHYGLIAEDLIKAGLEEFVIKGATGQAEGIEYDRLWTVLIPKIRDLSNNQINDRMTISRLEKEIEKLKQEVQSK